jgi:hypothetical protein
MVKACISFRIELQCFNKTLYACSAHLRLKRTKQKLATFAVHYVNTLGMGLACHVEAQGNGIILTLGSRAR